MAKVRSPETAPFSIYIYIYIFFFYVLRLRAIPTYRIYRLCDANKQYSAVSILWKLLCLFEKWTNIQLHTRTFALGSCLWSRVDWLRYIPGSFQRSSIGSMNNDFWNVLFVTFTSGYGSRWASYLNLALRQRPYTTCGCNRTRIPLSGGNVSRCQVHLNANSPWARGL